MPGKKYLIGQLGSYGDCLYATTIARQLKNDEPDCHITWAICLVYRSVLDENPYVDTVWEFPSISGRLELLSTWTFLSKEAYKRKKSGEFDEIYLTQLFPNNLRYFDGTIRSSIFRSFRRPVTVPVSPVMVLRQDEIDAVKNFASTHNLSQYDEVILFETSPRSGQSFLSSAFAIDVAKALIANSIKNICIIMSSSESITNSCKNIIDGSELTFRQNAELTKYCTLFVGASSGISWLCTSEWAKPLPMVLLLEKKREVFASMVHDHEYFKLPSSHIIEMTNCSVERVASCISEIISKGIQQARIMYHEHIPISFHNYFGAFKYNKTSLLGIIQSFMYTARRYGFFKLCFYLVINAVRVTKKTFKKAFSIKCL